MFNKKRKTNEPDKLLIIFSAILILVGVVFLSTVSIPYSLSNFNEPFHYLKHQLSFGLLLGLISIFFIYRYKINIENLKKISFYFFIFNLFLVFLTIIPSLNESIGGASRWINFGVISFQPTEFLKLSFILYFGAWLSERQKFKKVDKKKQITEVYFPFIFLLGMLAILLFLQPDISTLGVIFLTGLAMYFVSKTPKWQTLLLVSLFVIFLFSTMQGGYRSNRLAVFLNPELDPMGIGYQMKQIKIAVGSGGLLGVEGNLSFGLSRQKFGFIPHPISDSIFAIYAEEMGFIGCVALILSYLFFVFRGFLISKKMAEKDLFLSLVAFGITFWIGFQSFFNIGAILGILPLTGIPLVFISYGSSALLSGMLGLGILIKISTMVE